MSVFRFIAAERVHHPVKTLCRVLGVSRSASTPGPPGPRRSALVRTRCCSSGSATCARTESRSAANAWSGCFCSATPGLTSLLESAPVRAGADRSRCCRAAVGWHLFLDRTRCEAVLRPGGRPAIGNGRKLRGLVGFATVLCRRGELADRVRSTYEDRTYEGGHKPDGDRDSSELGGSPPLSEKEWFEDDG